MSKKIAFGLVTLFSVVLLAACEDSLGDKYVGFARCLSSKNAVMYGAYWCPHCQNQKKLFGKLGFAEVNYVECDAKGPAPQPALCKANDIKGFPTWIFKDKSRTEGETSLETLSEKTGCALPAASE